MGELLRSSENEQHVSIKNEDEPKHLEEIQDDLASNNFIEEDIQEVKNDMEKEGIQEVEEEGLCKMEDGLHVKHASRSMELSQTQEVKEINTEYHQNNSSFPTFSYLKHLPNQNLEVFKNVHMQKNCKQRGRPSKKRAALSFASSSTVKRKSKTDFCTKSCLQENSSISICNSTIKGQSSCADIANNSYDTCKSQGELLRNIKPSN